MLYYETNDEFGLGCKLHTLRIFDEDASMTEIAYRHDTLTNTPQLVSVSFCETTPDTFSIKTHRFDKVTAAHVQPILTAWANMGLKLLQEVSKERKAKFKAVKAAA